MATTGAVQRGVTVTNPAGLHLRPATAVAQLARRFEAQLTVCNGPSRADARSPTALIMLIAMPGAELTVEADGPDAAEAVDAVCALLGDPGDGQ